METHLECFPCLIRQFLDLMARTGLVCIPSRD